MALSEWIGGWSPGIGDPSFLGWFTVAAYLGGAWACWRARQAAVRGRLSGGPAGTRRLWGVLAAGLLALGINKQLDLQSAITEMGRIVAREMAWDEDRRVLQFGFIGVVVLLAIALCAWLAYLARQELRRVLPALIGCCVLCSFVAIRAASFHHVDRFLGTRFAGARMNAILELGGIALIAIGAFRYGRTPR